MGLGEEVLDDFFKRIQTNSKIPGTLPSSLKGLLSQGTIGPDQISAVIEEALKLGRKRKEH